MNIQPYGVPDRRWSPKLTPWWFRLAGILRRRALKQQRINRVEVEGLDHLKESLKAGHGILLVPNHSFHWDSYCLVESAVPLATPFYFMTAWQVFAQSNWFDCESMRRCGCFSVDREGTDIQSLKTAVDIMQNRREPLVIFPEGDVYHTNDRLTPFRDGAAAMALMAARKAERSVVIIPVAIKRWYTEDPTPSMLKTVEQLELRLYWRPRNKVPLRERILHVADGLLTLKELEYFGTPTRGPLVNRIHHLASSVLSGCEDRYEIDDRIALIPERIKEVRRRIIQAQLACFPQPNENENTQIIAPEKKAADSKTAVPNAANSTATETQQRQWLADMDDMFFVTQLFSYPGDYLDGNPSWERLAETLDKLEEDALNAIYPSVRGPRHVLVRYDQPIELPRGKEKRESPAQLTDRIEQRVQSMLDEMNAAYAAKS